MKLYHKAMREVKALTRMIVLLALVFQGVSVVVVTAQRLEHLRLVEGIQTGKMGFWLMLGNTIGSFFWMFFMDILVIVVGYSQAKARTETLRNYVREMTTEEQEALDYEWERCQKFYGKARTRQNGVKAKRGPFYGNIVAITSEYLILRKGWLKIHWTIIPLREIRQVCVLEESFHKQVLHIKYQNVFFTMKGGSPFLLMEERVTGYGIEELCEIRKAILKAIEKGDSTKAFHLKSKLFDEIGSYGGKQDISRNMPEYVRANAMNMICEKYKRAPLSEEEFETFLKRMNSEGCGYVALANTILLYFEDKPEEFQRLFGYPLLTEDGDFCFDYLLLDLYSSMDNVVPMWKWRDLKADYTEEVDGDRKSYDYWKDTTGKGTTSEEREYYIESFMKQHGVLVEAKAFANVTPKNFERLSKEGYYVIASVFNGQIRNKYECQNILRHAMLITGVNESGDYIVSSWGREFLLNPQKNDNINFSIVKYCAIIH